MFKSGKKLMVAISVPVKSWVTIEILNRVMGQNGHSEQIF